MLYFTILKAARQLALCPVDNEGHLGAELDVQYVQFYSSECLVATREGLTRLYYVREIKRESDACISGYCVEGEDEL